MPEYPLIPGDGASLIWLCEIDWLGRTFRWATEECDVVDGTTTHHYEGGLDLDYEESIEFGSSTIAQPTVSIRGLYLPADIDLPALIEAGHRMHRAPIRLAIWVPGRTYAKRVVRFVGVVTASGYGSAAEALNLTACARGFDTVFELPRASEKACDATWSTAGTGTTDGAWDGEQYPYVIGEPGYGTVTHSYNNGSPAIVVDTTNFYALISAGHVAASAVDVIDTDDLVEDNLAVTLSYDDLGQPISRVTLGGTCPYADGHEYWVRWPSSDGGLLDPWRADTCLRGAGGVVRWAIGLSGADADAPRWTALQAELDAYLIDTYLDDSVPLWPWLEAVVLPMLPLAMATGASGLYPVLWRPTAPPVRAVDVQRDGLSREGDIEFADDWISEVRVKYRPDSSNGDFRSEVRITGHPQDGSDPDSHSCAHLVAARSTLGLEDDEERTESIELVGCTDRSTAIRAGLWRAMLHAMPSRPVSYADPTGAMVTSLLGDPIAWTDSDVSMSGRVGHLVRFKWHNSALSVGLVFVDDLVLDGRS